MVCIALALVVASCSTSGSSAGGGGGGSAGSASQCNGSCGNVNFISSQAQPVAEQTALRNNVLAGFNGKVDFTAPDDPLILNTIQSQEQAGQVKLDVLGDLDGSFPGLQQQGNIQDVSALMSRLQQSRQFDQSAVKLGKLGTDKQYYVPWMRGTYMMVANKKAMQYLPKGASIDDLTYDQLVQWGQNMKQATGQNQIGLPAGPKGLIERFLEGYVYPSYTGGEVSGFKSSGGVQAWEMLQKLWAVTNPQSTNYGFMQEPLESGEVMVAWDNTVRLIKALDDQPDQFVSFPAPRGPKGRGYISVLVGLGIIKGAPNQKGAEALIDYLTQSQQQQQTVKAISFFSVLNNVTVGSDASPGLQAESKSAQKQSSSKGAITALLPVGLGSKNADYNKVFRDAFTRIILQNQAIQDTLATGASQLQSIITAQKAPCWAPDPPSSGPCTVG